MEFRDFPGMWRSTCLPTLFVLLAVSGLEAVVISEIHYNAAAGNERLEFIEISNETTTPEDLSGWEFIEGIQYVFPPQTILPARATIVVCKDAEAVRTHYGIDNVLGNYTGNLAGSGERVTLVNHVGIVIQTLRYDDEGKWPVGPHGSGHTLALDSLYLDPSEPESWRQSVQLGGTPGLPTYPEVGAPLIDRGALWRYRKGSGPFSDGQDDWRQANFDDGDWSEGATPIGNRYGDEATLLDDLPGNYSTVACRAHFELAEGDIAGPRELFLALQFDDGFCVWVNGKEAVREGCAEDADWDSTATVDHRGFDELLFRIPAPALRVGDNVIAILGLNSELGSPRFRLSPRLVQPLRPRGEPTPGSELVFNELFRGTSPGEGWVEIYNTSSRAVDLGTYQLTDNADRLGAGGTFTFPQPTAIAPGDFLVVSELTAIDFFQAELRLFLLRPDRAVVAAHVFSRSPPLDVGPGTYSEAHFPDGGRPRWLTLSPTPGTPNEVAREESLVINEIFYHPPDDPPGEPRSEFLELFNRGTTPIDLNGFRFNNGIDYTFTDVSIGPGEYVVLADDPDLIAEHHGYDRAIGPYNGSLANDGESIRLVDRLGNVVDEVRYHEGGDWSPWADGRGASLELTDPFADNDVGAAWDASDESEKASWEQLSYSVPSHVPSGQNGFHFLLAERGICRIDDVSVTSNSRENHIPNPGFEAETTEPWLMQGTHVHSRRVTTDSHSGTACLEVVATSKGNTAFNRLFVEMNPHLTAGPYDVSLWARWQRGTSLIITHSDFRAGEFTAPGEQNLSSNTLGARLRMTVPYDLGTPGSENSVRRDNLGPVISGVIHSPAVPGDSDPILVTARVSDFDGVSAARVVFRVDLPDEDFQSQPLFDDGLHRDGAAGDGLYRGEIPGVRAGTSVVFYIEGTDTLGNVLASPRAAPDETHVILVGDARDLVRDTSRILLDSARTAELTARPGLSNDVLHGTFVLNESEVFYNVGVRYRGSAWGGRPERQNFRVRFARDTRFLRGLKEINVSKRALRDDQTDEGSAYFVIGRVGTRDHPTAVPEYLYVDGWFNRTPNGVQALIEPVNRGFISRWYGDNATGPVLKATGRQQYAARDLIPATQWASLTYKGEETERYRFYWFHSIRQTQDDWQPYLDFCKIMDPAQTSDEQFDMAIDNVLDVERFFRVHAARVIMGDDDALFVTRGHNGYLVRDSNTGLWSLLPFDMDIRFRFGRNLFLNDDPAVGRLFERPRTRRTYFRVLADYVDGYWSVERAGPWLDALEDALEEGTPIDTRDIIETLTKSNPFVREELLKFDKPFRVFPADETETATARVFGEAPFKVATMEVKVDAQAARPLTPTWTSEVAWHADVELDRAVTTIEVTGYDGLEQRVGSASIEVLSTAFDAFQRGDVTGDGTVDVRDALSIVEFLFLHGPMACLDAADVEDDGRVTVLDTIRLILYLFAGGQEPAPPFEVPGQDPTDDALGCGP
jgi:hypothetical protein